jgi:hypothetical protein
MQDILKMETFDSSYEEVAKATENMITEELGQQWISTFP